MELCSLLHCSVAHCAAENGNTKVIGELEKRGANMWLCSNNGQYPLHEALKSSKAGT